MITAGSIRTAKQTAAFLVMSVAAIYLVLVMYTNLPLYLDRLSGETNAPQLYILQLALGALLFVVAFPRARQFVFSSYALWIGALILMYVVTYLRLVYLDPSADEDDISHAFDRIERAVLIPVFGLICFLCKPKFIEILFFIAIVLIPVPVILGFFYPDLFPSSVNTRSAGMYFNANQACEAVLLWLLIIHRRIPRMMLLPVYVLAGVAVVLTFSRSGMVGWGIIGAYLIYSRRISRLAILVPLTMAVFYTTIMSNAEELLAQFIDDESKIEEMIDRLDVFGKIGGGEENDYDDSSKESREEIAADTLAAALLKPLLGYGYDVERDLGLNAHNMFLQLWYTFGLAGLLIYVWLAYLLYLAGLQQGYGHVSPYLLIYFWFSFFDHAHTTDNYWLIAYAFVLRGLSWRKSATANAKTQSRSRRRSKFGRAGRRHSSKSRSSRTHSGSRFSRPQSSGSRPSVQSDDAVGSVINQSQSTQGPGSSVAVAEAQPERRRRKRRRRRLFKY